MKKINSLQFCTCFITVLIAPFLGIEIYSILKFSKVNSLITIILSLLISFIFIYIFLKIFDYEKDYDLKNKIEKLFDKKISIVIMYILSFCFLIIGSCFFFDINNFVISQFLSETPIYIVGILLSILIIYINSKGIEVITRVSTVLFCINILLFLLAINGYGGKIELNNMLPILEDGIKPVLIGCIYCISLSLGPIFLLLIIPKNSIVGNKKTNKMIVISNIIGFLFFGTVIFVTISVLGIYLTSLYQYPAYMVLKRVSLLGFLDRIENLIIIQWIFQIFITLSLIVYFINKLTHIKPYIITLLMLISSLLIFKNNTFFDETVILISPYISGIIFIIFFVIFIKIKIKKKV